MTTSAASDPQPPDRDSPEAVQNRHEAGAEYDFLHLVGICESISKNYRTHTLNAVLSRSYRAWNNEHAENSKYLGAGWRGRSRLYVPKTRSAVRKNLATAAAALFSTDDVLSLSAEYEDDPVQRATAAVIKADVDYRLTRSSQVSGIPWFLIAMGGCLDAQLTGVTISKQYWEYQEIETSETEEVETAIIDESGNETTAIIVRPKKRRVKDRPMIEILAIENVGVDPAAPWYDPAQLGMYFYADHPMHVGDIRARMRSPDKRGINDWIEVPDTILRMARIDDQAAGIRRAREGGRDRLEESKSVGETDIVFIRENFYRVGGVDYHFWSVGQYAYLSEVRETLESYPELGGERPYKFGLASIDTHKVFPMPPVESWQPLQLELNDIANLRLDTLKRAIAPIAKVRQGAHVDLTQVQRRGQPDAVLLLQKMEDVMFEPTPGPNGAAYTETSMNNAMFDELAGVYSTSSVASNRQLNETVGGMRLFAGAANSVSEFDLRVWVETWIEPVLRQVVHFVRHNEDDETIMRIAGSKAQVMTKHDGFMPTVDDFLDTEITLRVNVGIGAADPMQKLQKLKMAFDMLAPLFPVMQRMGIDFDIEAVIEEVMGGAGFRDGRRFFKFGEPQEQGPPPGLAEAMEKIKLEHEKLDFAREKFMAELRAGAQESEQDNATKLQIEDKRARTDLVKHAMGIASTHEEGRKNRIARLLEVFSQTENMGAGVNTDEDPSDYGIGQNSGDVGLPALNQPQPPAPSPSNIVASAMIDQIRSLAEQVRMVGEMVAHIDAKMNAPVEVLRDEMGRPIGTRRAGQVQMIQRGPDGRVIGTAPVAPG